MFNVSIGYNVIFFNKEFAELVICVLYFIVFSVQPFCSIFLVFFDSFCSCIFVWIIFVDIFGSCCLLCLSRDWLFLDRWKVLQDFLNLNQYQYFHRTFLNILLLWLCLLLCNICHFPF